MCGDLEWDIKVFPYFIHKKSLKKKEIILKIYDSVGTLD